MCSNNPNVKTTQEDGSIEEKQQLLEMLIKHSPNNAAVAEVQTEIEKKSAAAPTPKEALKERLEELKTLQEEMRIKGNDAKQVDKDIKVLQAERDKDGQQSRDSEWADFQQATQIHKGIETEATSNERKQTQLKE